MHLYIDNSKVRYKSFLYLHTHFKKPKTVLLRVKKGTEK